MAMAQPGGPEQTREDVAGDGFTDVIKSRAGRTSLAFFLVWGCIAYPLHSAEAVLWKLAQGFGKLWH